MDHQVERPGYQFGKLLRRISVSCPPSTTLDWVYGQGDGKALTEIMSIVVSCDSCAHSLVHAQYRIAQLLVSNMLIFK